MLTSKGEKTLLDRLRGAKRSGYGGLEKDALDGLEDALNRELSRAATEYLKRERDALLYGSPGPGLNTGWVFGEAQMPISTTVQSNTTFWTGNGVTAVTVSTPPLSAVERLLKDVDAVCRRGREALAA